MTQAGPAVVDVQIADLSCNELELNYSKNIDLAHRKRLGQFFTPFSIARFMSQWITGVNANHPQILDPCAGLGVFERAICETNPEFANRARFVLWEKDDAMSADLADVCQKLKIEYSVNCGDFIDGHAWSASYDGIIANPPYYKHHFVKNKNDVCRVMSEKVGSPFSVQTNIYCWFLIKSLSLLRPGGRLAFIIPTEFLNANYGRDVKRYLLDTGHLRHLISVCYKSRTFDDAITTACVLLAEKGVEPPSDIRFYKTESPDHLGELPDFLSGEQYIEYQPEDLDAERKWRSCFPGNTRIETQASDLVPFSTYGRFSRGIATGANEFFAIRQSRAREYDLPSECLIPCVSKARQAPDRIFSQRDFEDLLQADQPVLLFDGQGAGGDAVQRYVHAGQQLGYHNRYLTRMRSPWFALEQRQLSKIWVGVFGRAGIRFIWNDSQAITLTCFHVFQPSEVGEAYLPFLFLYLNSATGRTFLELEKREYGDGLEKYEPNDINKAFAPDFSSLDQRDTERLIALQKIFLTSERDSTEDSAILAEADLIFSALKLRG